MEAASVVPQQPYPGQHLQLLPAKISWCENFTTRIQGVAQAENARLVLHNIINLYGPHTHLDPACGSSSSSGGGASSSGGGGRESSTEKLQHMRQTVYRPRAGLIAITLVKKDCCSKDQAKQLAWLVYGSEDVAVLGLMTVTSACVVNLVNDTTSEHSPFRSSSFFVVGDCKQIFKDDCQVLWVDICALLQDAQNGPPHPSGGAVYEDVQFTADTLTSRPLASVASLGKIFWRTVGSLADGKIACLTVMLATMAVFILTAHPQQTKQLHYHTVWVTYGGCFSCGTKAVTISPQLAFGGHVMLGHQHAPLHLAAAETLRRMVEDSRVDDNPMQIAEDLLRPRLESALPPARHQQIDQDMLVAVVAQLQLWVVHQQQAAAEGEDGSVAEADSDAWSEKEEEEEAS